MDALNTILIDDEQNNLDNLSALLKEYCPEVRIVATAMNADDGIAAISAHRPELILLDIQMPGRNGFEMLRDLSSYDFDVIVVTAYDQYAIQAVRFAAVDYLLKPVSISDLQSAVGRALTRNRQKRQHGQIENLMKFLQQRKEEHRIALTTLKETRYVNTSEIIRCESSNNYSIFYLAGGEKLTVSKPIFEFEELLSDYGFIRCHQSHLVNRQYVKSWVKEDGGYLLLDNADQVPVSRNKKEMVQRALG